MRYSVFLLVIASSGFTLVSGNSFDCSNCNDNAACKKVCSSLGTMKTTTTTKRPPWVKTKPSWWIPLDCLTCFGWSNSKNITIKKHCRFGCEFKRGNINNKKTTLPTTTTSTTPITTTPTTKPPTKLIRPFNELQILSVGTDAAKQHTSYLWVLAGVIGVGLIITTVVAATVVVSGKKRQRVGTLDIVAQQQHEFYIGKSTASTSSIFTMP